MPRSDPEARREYDRSYRKRRGGEILQRDRLRAKKYREMNPEKRAETQLRYRAGMRVDVRERIAERQKQWRKANPRTPEQRAADNLRRREQTLLAKYGMGSADIAKLLNSQGGKCKICGSKSPGSRYGWHTDHCHETKKVRGVLCRSCNMHLGAFRHDPFLLRRAADYVENFGNIPDAE